MQVNSTFLPWTSTPAPLLIEVLGEDGCLVGFAVAVTVDKPADAIVVTGVLKQLVAEMLAMVGNPVFDRLRGQVIIQPLLVVSAVVGDAAVLTK